MKFWCRMTSSEAPFLFLVLGFLESVLEACLGRLIVALGLGATGRLGAALAAALIGRLVVALAAFWAEL